MLSESVLDGASIVRSGRGMLNVNCLYLDMFGGSYLRHNWHDLQLKL